MQRLDESNKPNQSSKSLAPSINLICSKCDNVIPKNSMFCKNCNIQHKNFDEEWSK